MEAAAVIELLQSAVPGAAYEVGHNVDMPTIYVPAGSLVATCGALRDHPMLQFNVLVEVTSVHAAKAIAIITCLIRPLR